MTGQNGECETEMSECNRAEDALRKSVQRLKRAQEIAHLGSWELDLTKNELTWSDEVYRIFGLEPQEFGATYEAFLERVHPDDRAAVDAAYTGSLREGRDSYEIDHRVVRKNTGEIRFVHEKCEHIRDESGRIIRSAGMVHDITERKRAEQELAQAREEAEQWAARLASFIASMADGVTLFDADGRVIMMNEAGRAMVGAPEGDDYADWSRYQRITLDGKPFPTEEAAAMRALRGEVVRDFRYRLISPWGKDVIISVSASPVLDADGRVLGATNVFRDITGQVEIEKYQQSLLERERHITEMLQSVLIPDRSYDIPGCDIAVRYEPAYNEANVGGDFYDIFDLGDENIGILIGDVAGKGLQAAMRVAAVRYSVRGYAYLDPRPSRVLAMANNALYRDSIEDAPMVTAVFAVVDMRVGVISYANGGHEPIVLRTARGDVELLNVPGRALGVMPGGDYVEDSRILRSGDSVVMVTDGITEARGRDGQFFEIEGVAASLAGAKRLSADRAATKVLETAKWYAGGALRDDAAIVVFGLKKAQKR